MARIIALIAILAVCPRPGVASNVDIGLDDAARDFQQTIESPSLNRTSEKYKGTPCEGVDMTKKKPPKCARYLQSQPK